MEITYDEIMDVLEIKCTSASSTVCSLAPAIYEDIDNNLILKPFFSR